MLYVFNSVGVFHYNKPLSSKAVVLKSALLDVGCMQVQDLV